MERGELYIEFRKCNSDECCHCSEIPGAVPNPIPRPEPNQETGHYKTYSDTSSSKTKRKVDDFQPRKQCKVLFDSGKISLSKKQEIEAFSEKYLVDKEVVTSYITHLSDLDLKKKLRKNAKDAGKSKQNSLESSHNDLNSDDDAILDDVVGSDDDVILNEVVGSDDEEDSDEELTYVPSLRVATRNGQLGGAWQEKFSLEVEDHNSSNEELSSESESSEVEEVTRRTRRSTTTRSGRKATYYNKSLFETDDEDTDD